MNTTSTLTKGTRVQHVRTGMVGTVIRDAEGDTVPVQYDSGQRAAVYPADLFTPGQRVTRNADNANGTIRTVTADGVGVDMDHGTDVLGDVNAFRPIFEPTHMLGKLPVRVTGTHTIDGVELVSYVTDLDSTEWNTPSESLSELPAPVVGPEVTYRDVHGVIWQGTLVYRDEHDMFRVERRNGPATIRDTARLADIITATPGDTIVTLADLAAEDTMPEVTVTPVQHHTFWVECQDPSCDFLVPVRGRANADQVATDHRETHTR